ncbi:hypothetical protein WA026_022173 [Henosepilachna vigintioctopunctata]|uniref:Uncharacterized protein n=1 Tax=Henosepilachna vigintioctopunctata TaxID=420089 RepID=A0AAW1TRD7_9CUCU
MVPQPRDFLHLYLGHNFRFYKSAVPTRNWIINGNKRATRGDLPPLSPYCRRGSNTRIPIVSSNSSPVTPNRSRSLDGLLDAEPSKPSLDTSNKEITPSQTTRSCDDLDKSLSEIVISQDKKPEEEEATTSLDNNSKCPTESEDDKISMNSSTSDSKRKRNFMDRCVNKVRNFIIKK